MNFENRLIFGEVTDNLDKSIVSCFLTHSVDEIGTEKSQKHLCRQQICTRSDVAVHIAERTKCDSLMQSFRGVDRFANDCGFPGYTASSAFR